MVSAEREERTGLAPAAITLAGVTEFSILASTISGRQSSIGLSRVPQSSLRSSNNSKRRHRKRYTGLTNGDRWLIAHDPSTGRVFVRHEPNVPSVSQLADIELGVPLCSWHWARKART